ncbi:TPA: hypothetical protein ACPY5Y_003811 [Yersinia enterocolitica]|uniref:hypothetical protein n=1 Tax=Yersinia enterocolitica TaxID=630 RepID=UPI0005E3046D|nr:hypothetical protein [Yersinia enterocolitica]CNG74346.1 Uncharacterised protein [Yersinia enterocolitica]CQH57035.1 Uncharacterised protein [Yersinia enterocolitica]HDL7059213.1 hypothetical protein [Yersinia enterocolitica]HDM8084147.1 hypothetical protein [Yersinia enterocolitica]
MSESIISIKLSISDYIPPAILHSPGSEQIHTKLQRYMKDGWKVKDETTYVGGEIVRSVVTKKQVINNIKTVITETFDSATNKINRITEAFDFNNNVKRIVVEQFDYDAVNKKISQTNRIEATQDIEPQKMIEHKNINDELIQKHQVNESKIFEQGSKLNSSLPDASTHAPAETSVKKALLDSKPGKKYEPIDGKRFLVTKDELAVDKSTRVQEVRRDNSRFIANITSNYQNGNVILKTATVREVDPVTKKHLGTEIHKTKYTYDPNNKLPNTHTESKFYGPDKTLIGFRDQRVENKEIFFDSILKYHSDGSNSHLFLNEDGNYENTHWGDGKKIGQSSFLQSWFVSKTGLPIPPLKSDTINPKVTPTAEYPGQLADAINSFPSKEINPAPTDKIISSQIPERLRNIVPDRRYPV